MPQDRQFVEALARGLAVLEALSRAQRPLGNGAIARETGLAPSTVSRLTHTLVTLGYLRPGGDGRVYALTAKNLALGYPVLAGLTLADRARPVLRDLAEATGETAALAMRDGLHVTFVEVVTGSSLVSVRLVVGGRLPIAVAAAGVAVLSALPDGDRRALTARVRGAISRRGADPAAFDRALSEASGSGLAVMRNAWRPGIGGVAVPVRIGEDILALTIPVATGSVTEAAMRGPLASRLREAAARLSAG
ncbi:MAG: IclR family transcriptional regulator [Gemmobacter sp.]